MTSFSFLWLVQALARESHSRKFDLNITQSMKTLWQEYSAAARSYSSAPFRTHSASTMTWNNWETIAETWSYLFRWRSRCCRRHPYLSSLRKTENYETEINLGTLKQEGTPHSLVFTTGKPQERMTINKGAPLARKVEGKMSFDGGQNSFIMTIISPDVRNCLPWCLERKTIWRKMVAPKRSLKKRLINFLVWKMPYF